MEGPGKNKKNKIKNRKYCRVFRTWLANTSKTRLTASAGSLPDPASGAWPDPNTRETRLKPQPRLSFFIIFIFPGPWKSKKNIKKKKKKNKKKTVGFLGLGWQTLAKQDLRPQLGVSQIQLLAPGQTQTLEKQDLRPQQGLSSSSPWRLARPKY